MFSDPAVYVPLIFVLSSIVLTVIMVGTQKARLAKEREQARALAASLGLAYLGGREALEAAYRESGAIGSGTWSSLQKLPAPIVDLIIAMAPWRLSGERQGLRVEVFVETRNAGKSSTTWTVARAWLPEAAPFELRIAHEGFFAKVGKALFKLEDIELGDPDFDAELRIKASDGTAAMILLNRAETKAALRALIGTHHGATVTERFAQWERQGIRTDVAEIGAVLDLVVAVARSLASR
jgi:hypothetical protein